MDISKLFEKESEKISDSKTIFGLCYEKSTYHSRNWSCVPLESQNIDDAVVESANIIKKQREINGKIYIVDYDSKPAPVDGFNSLNGNSIYCLLMFKPEFKSYMGGFGGYFVTEGIENIDNWVYIDREVTLF